MVRRDAVTASSACGARATGTPWRATATTSAIDRERPSSVIVAGMRKGSYCSEIRDAKVDAEMPRREVVHSAPRRPGVYLAATARPLDAGRFGGTSSAFPESVCTLQSKITYWRLTAVTRRPA